MNKKTAFAALLLLAVMLFQFFPAAQTATAATTCNWAQFVADVTIPDGTTFKPGETFNKTWRLKNIGSCTWSADYSLTFVSGDQMGAPATVKFPKAAAPGETIDLTVAMTAPNNAGTYRGYWQLKNASGVLFGIGAAANKSFWVEIKVSTGTVASGFDFVASADKAAWSSGAGTLTFPGSEGDAKGFVRKIDNPKLENGTADSVPGLLAVPQNVYGGYIQGVYPAFKVQTGDRFQSIINCEFNATSCYVNFRLDYQIGSGAVKTFWSFNERYEGLFYRADLNLNSLAGQEVKFILYVGAAGYATGDRALWGAPRIARPGTGPTITPTVTGPTLTPTITLTPSHTPTGNTCDRATFVADNTVPDGSVFAPNASFTKTWRIKNTGTCTWTTAYSLVFVSGEKMSGPDSKNLGSTIAPNTTVDFSVDLKAPASNGSHRGYWQFKNAAGQLFGIGAAGNKPFWVDIVVKDGTVITVTPSPTAISGSSYDFAASAGSATWSSGAGTLTFPGSDGDARGFAIKFDSTQLETGATETRPTLLTVPQNKTDGYIQAVYPALAIKSGDRFQATIGCQYAATSCYITYRLDYRTSAGTKTLWTFRERYEGQVYNVNLDLAPLAGQNVQFILLVLASGSATGDRAVWVAPRITHSDTVPPTPTPTLTPQSGVYLGPYAVFAVASNDTLNVRSGPGVSYPIVAGLASNAHDVMRTGRATTVGSAIWWEVQKPGGGTGWSHSSYLTEYVAPSAFCANTSVNALLTSLGTAIKNADGAAFAALVNEKHGVDVRLVSRNKPVNFNKTAAAGIFTSTASYSWGAAEGSGLETTGAFKDVMQPKLLEVFNEATTPACNDTSKTGTVSQPWPPEYSPFNFYSIHKPAASGSLDWRTFLVGVEFVEGKPYVVSLVHFQWAP